MEGAGQPLTSASMSRRRPVPDPPGRRGDRRRGGVCGMLIGAAPARRGQAGRRGTPGGDREGVRRRAAPRRAGDRLHPQLDGLARLVGGAIGAPRGGGRATAGSRTVKLAERLLQAGPRRRARGTPTSGGPADLSQDFKVAVLYSGSGAETVAYSQSTAACASAEGGYVDQQQDTVSPMSWSVRYVVDLDSLVAAVRDAEGDDAGPGGDLRGRRLGGERHREDEPHLPSTTAAAARRPPQRARSHFSAGGPGADGALSFDSGAGLEVGVPMRGRAAGSAVPRTTRSVRRCGTAAPRPRWWTSSTCWAAASHANPYGRVRVAGRQARRWPSHGLIASPCQGDSAGCSDSMRGPARSAPAGHRPAESPAEPSLPFPYGLRIRRYIHSAPVETVPERLEPTPEHGRADQPRRGRRRPTIRGGSRAARTRRRRRRRWVATDTRQVLLWIAVIYLGHPRPAAARGLPGGHVRPPQLPRRARQLGWPLVPRARQPRLPHLSLPGQTTLGFFPLYPIAIWVLESFVMLVFGHDQIWAATVAGVIISTIGGYIATVLVYRLAESWWGREARGGRRSCSSYSRGRSSSRWSYSEGLLLPLAAGCMYALQRRRWLLAGVLAGFGTAVRPGGAGARAHVRGGRRRRAAAAGLEPRPRPQGARGAGAVVDRDRRLRAVPVGVDRDAAGQLRGPAPRLGREDRPAGARAPDDEARRRGLVHPLQRADDQSQPRRSG